MAERKRKDRRAKKAIETKEKIYKSAKILFSENAYNNVTVSSIVKLAGVAKGTFYLHFDSKDALITSFITDYVKELDLGYRSYLESLPEDRSVSDIMMLMVEKITDVIIESIGYDVMRALYRIQLTRDVSTEAVFGYNRDLYKMFTHLIAKGIEKGEFNIEPSVNSVAKHFIMAIRGLVYEWCIRFPNFDLKKEAEQYYRILIKGIKKIQSPKK